MSERFILERLEVCNVCWHSHLKMGPKKAKKTKAELEEEKLAREEEERKAKIAEDKRNAEDAEKRRLEQLRVEGEQKNARELELQRLKEEFEAITDDLKSKELQLLAEEKREVCYILIFCLFITP